MARRKLEAERDHLREWLERIRDYTPTEICYDQWAYARMTSSYRSAAREGLRRKKAWLPMPHEHHETMSSGL